MLDSKYTLNMVYFSFFMQSTVVQAIYVRSTTYITVWREEEAAARSTRDTLREWEQLGSVRIILTVL